MAQKSLSGQSLCNSKFMANHLTPDFGANSRCCCCFTSELQEGKDGNQLDNNLIIDFFAPKAGAAYHYLYTVGRPISHKILFGYVFFRNCWLPIGLHSSYSMSLMAGQKYITKYLD